MNTDGVRLRQVRVVAERLSLVGEGADLLAWSSDKYGRPTSYSRLDDMANLVIVNVDAAAASQSDCLSPRVISLSVCVMSSEPS